MNSVVDDAAVNLTLELEKQDAETHQPDGVLRVENLSKSFGPRQVLRNFSCTLAKGQILAVLGESGCGKSTLLRILAGLDRDFEGHVQWLTGKQPGVVFQEPRLLPWLTVSENVGFSSRRRQFDSACVERLVDLVGLTGHGDKLPKVLSGGMAQRVALARALYSSDEGLLMDEPFSALDALTRRRMQDELLRIQKRLDLAVVLITHDIDEALRLADQVIVLGKGRVIDQFSVKYGGCADPSVAERVDLRLRLETALGL